MIDIYDFFVTFYYSAYFVVSGPLYTLLYLFQIGDWDSDDEQEEKYRSKYQQYNLNDFSFIELAKYHYFDGTQVHSYIGRMPYLLYGEFQDIFTLMTRFLITFPTFWMQPSIILATIYLRFVDPEHTGAIFEYINLDKATHQVGMKK